MWIKLSLTKQRENTTLSSTNLGFTIVELLVVIVVIGILAALVIVSYTGITQKAAAAVLQSDLKNASTKLELVKAETGTYSADDSSLPKSNSTDYQYTVSPDGSSYSLSATDGSPIAFHTTSATGGAIVAGVDTDAGHILPGGEVATGWKQIGAGYRHTCAISLDDKAYCWGDNQYKELGNGNNTNSSVPVAVDTTGVLNGKTVKILAVGPSNTCVIASDDKAYCWGGNYYGTLGDGSSNDSNVPVAVSTAGVLSGKTIKSITVGSDNACVIASDDKAYCWGGNGYGDLGNNQPNVQSNVPVAVNTAGVFSGKTIKSIATGNDYHTCAIASDNLVYCWGYNNAGQLGNNTIIDSPVAVAVNTAGVFSGKTIKTISVGAGGSTCAIASDNNAYCWGYNGTGRLGDNTTTDRYVPVAVSTAGVLSGKTVVSISAGSNHTCAIASDNQSYCWGWNSKGQLGNNSTTYSSVPVAVNTTGVLNGKTIQSISAGGSHTCTVVSDNQAYCWGQNGYNDMMDGDVIYGQLGNNSSDLQSLVPVTVSAL